MVRLVQRIVRNLHEILSFSAYTIQVWQPIDTTFYQTEIFKDNKRGIEPHVLLLMCDPLNMQVIGPISQQQRRFMLNPNIVGPRGNWIADTSLGISKGTFESKLEDTAVFSAFFYGGRFVYAEEHAIPGPHDPRSLVDRYYTPQQFMVRINQYFNLEPHDTFRSFFTKSNLPQPHVNALEAILK